MGEPKQLTIDDLLERPGARAVDVEELVDGPQVSKATRELSRAMQRQDAAAYAMVSRRSGARRR